MKGYCDNIEQRTVANDDFRRVDNSTSSVRMRARVS